MSLSLFKFATVESYSSYKYRWWVIIRVTETWESICKEALDEWYEI